MTKSEDFLCKAYEMAEKSRDFFQQSVAQCAAPLAREVFEQLADQGKSQVDLVGEVYGSIQKGKSWAGSCFLGEADKDDVREVFRNLAEKYAHPGACPSEVGLVETALAMQGASIDFYDTWATQAEDEVEVEFVARMAAELRGRHMILADLKYYFEDPEGWALQQDNPVLDGA